MAGTRDSATLASRALSHSAMAGTAGLRTCPAPAGGPADKCASVLSLCTLQKHQKPLGARRKPCQYGVATARHRLQMSGLLHASLVAAKGWTAQVSYASLPEIL